MPKKIEIFTIGKIEIKEDYVSLYFKGTVWGVQLSEERIKSCKIRDLKHGDKVLVTYRENTDDWIEDIQKI